MKFQQYLLSITTCVCFIAVAIMSYPNVGVLPAWAMLLYFPGLGCAFAVIINIAQRAREKKMWEMEKHINRQMQGKSGPGPGESWN